MACLHFVQLLVARQLKAMPPLGLPVVLRVVLWPCHTPDSGRLRLACLDRYGFRMKYRECLVALRLYPYVAFTTLLLVLVLVPARLDRLRP